MNNEHLVEPIGTYDDILALSEESENGAVVVEEANENEPITDENAKELEEPKSGEPQETAPLEEPNGKKSQQDKKPIDGKEAVYKAKDGSGKEVELSGDLKIQKKVDGEMVEVSLDEALKHHAFDVPYKKRWQELDDKEKAFEQKQKEVEQSQGQLTKEVEAMGQQLITELKSLQTGDLESFVNEFAKIRKQNPAEVRSKLREMFLPEVQKYLEADEAEQKALDIEEHNRYIEQQKQLLQQQQALQQRLGQYREYAQQQLQAAELTVDDWSSAEDKIVAEQLGGQGLTDEQFAQLPPDQLQLYVDAIVTTARAEKQTAGFDRLVEKVSPDLKDDSPEQYEHIRDTLLPHMASYGEEDLLDVIREFLGTKEEVKEDKPPPKDDDIVETTPKSTDTLPGQTVYDDELDDEVWSQIEEDPLSVYR